MTVVLENLSGEGTLEVNAERYTYGTLLAADTQIALREDCEKKVKRIIYTNATPAVQNRLFDFFGRQYSMMSIGESLLMEVRK